MNISNIYNLFTFPSYFRRWRLSSVLSSFELRSLFGHHCSECGKRVCLFVCLFVCLDWVLCGLPIPIHTFTHTPSSSPTLLPPTGCDDHHLRRPTATLLLSPIQNMCGISSLAFTTVAHRDLLYFTGCRHLFRSISTFPCFRNPSVKPRTTAHHFLIKKIHNKHLLVEHFFNLPPRTTTR